MSLWRQAALTAERGGWGQSTGTEREAGQLRDVISVDRKWQTTGKQRQTQSRAQRERKRERWLTDPRARMGFYANFIPEVQTTIAGPSRERGIYVKYL